MPIDKTSAFKAVLLQLHLSGTTVTSTSALAKGEP
jgi:hypothetical protein